MRVSRRAALLFAGDIVIVLCSILLAWSIRAQFQYFLFRIWQVFIVLPYVMLARVAVNILSEQYALTFSRIHARDFLRLAQVNIVPSLAFLVVRFASPLEAVRMPISIILSEYLFSVSGMILFRFVLVREGAERGRPEAFAPSRNAVIVGRFEHERQVAAAVSAVADASGMVATDVLTDNRVLWGRDVGATRIQGGYAALDRLLGDSPSEGGRCVVLWGGQTFEELVDFARRCKRRGVLLACWFGSHIGPLTLTRLCLRATDYRSIDPPQLRRVTGWALEVLGGSTVSDVLRTSIAAASGAGRYAERDAGLAGPGSLQGGVVVSTSSVTASVSGLSTGDYEGAVLRETRWMIASASTAASAFVPLVVVPLMTGLSARRLMDRSNGCALLFTSGVLSDDLSLWSSWGGREAERRRFSGWETPEGIAVEVVLAAALVRDGARALYARGVDAMTTEEVERIARLLDPFAAGIEASGEDGVRSSEVSWPVLGEGLRLEETAYSSLFLIR